MEIDQRHIVSAMGMLAGTIAYLWRQQSTQHESTIKSLKECEAEHKIAAEKTTQLAMDLAELKGRQQGIQDLSEQVLAVVKEASSRD